MFLPAPSVVPHAGVDVSPPASAPAGTAPSTTRPTASWARSPAFGAALFWLAHAGFWMLAAGAMLVVATAFRPAIADPLFFVATRAGSCLVATAVLRWLSKRESLLERLGVSKIGLVAGGALSAAVRRDD
jgi:hypothetical protein